MCSVLLPRIADASVGMLVCIRGQGCLAVRRLRCLHCSGQASPPRVVKDCPLNSQSRLTEQQWRSPVIKLQKARDSKGSTRYLGLRASWIKASLAPNFGWGLVSREAVEIPTPVFFHAFICVQPSPVFGKAACPTQGSRIAPTEDATPGLRAEAPGPPISAPSAQRAARGHGRGGFGRRGDMETRAVWGVGCSIPGISCHGSTRWLLLLLG